jgi:chromosome segregation ATPase
MQCDICFRTGGQKLPFLCPTDARNRLYEPRVHHAQILLEKDALDQQITNLLSSPQRNGEASPNGANDRPGVARLLAEKDQALDRTQEIIAHADELRDKINKAREEIAKRKAIIDRRKSELASATNGVEARRNRQMDDVEKALRMTKYKWNQAHSITASSRTFLCGEAAKLYGLRRVRRNGAVEEYKIGGISVVDLRAMNSMNPNT